MAEGGAAILTNRARGIQGGDDLLHVRYDTAWVFSRPLCHTIYDAISESQIRWIYGDTIDALYAYVSRRCGGVREIAEDVTGNVVAGRRTWARDGIPSGAIAPVSSPRGRSPTH